LIFPPLAAAAFITLAPQYRTEGAGIFSLMRNIGSSIGISMVTFFLTRNLQVAHADIAAAVTPFNPNLTGLFGMPGPARLGQLDLLVNQQALMVSYVDDFYMLMWVTLAALPLVLLMS
ncbi:MAG: EmrB/QacA family drug resistance transporter, partial [Rhodobacteraceae bacterium]|nr:EmrB/QacA family drug resistance transporter [Paracoccaceae bacterium]